MYYRLFTWSKIYEPTAFFFRLLKMTLSDIIPFSIMMIGVITMTANIMYILNAQRTYDHEGNLYDDMFSNEMINSWIVQF